MPYMTSQIDLFSSSSILTGNTAKVKVLYELSTTMSQRDGLSILDIGCVGPSPLEFWMPLLEQYNFHLTGIDVAGIERAQKVVSQHNWKNRVTLQVASGYQLTDLFKRESFDVVVATQVLEHVAQIDRFMQQVAAVLCAGGVAYFTLDSAHFQSRFDLKDPIRLLKNLVKKVLSTTGNEHHYDLPWFDYEVADASQRAGLQVIETGYYNLTSLKYLHNQIVFEAQKNALMQKWFQIEEFLNQLEEVRNKSKHLFRALYLAVCKPEAQQVCN